ncbi:MAG: serine/threonine-protein kinase [Acidobacteria bacterium]|nr:serine/threonine-protein kinase [Acidobacteriota bacterium]
MIGTTLEQYRVTAALGEGGMGQVWLAEDTKLGREVALKVLPEEFAKDPERMARFEREAKVLASLNHPNIATLYGLESVESGSEETTFLAMELVQGEDLSERIKRGPVPIDEAVPIALQIAEALEAAHEQGIVHRDLKPANIKLRPDGTVKVLDFGLAKAWDADTENSNVSMSPTLTAHATAAGVIIGTAAYMSPEQAAGIAADRRADIWAFGVVLWEMLTGNKLFEGETVSHVLASVLKDEIDLEALPDDTPSRLRELISRCLRKKPKQRLQAIGDARIVLEEPLGDQERVAAGSDLATPSTPSRMISRLGWVAAVLGLGAAAFLLWLQIGGKPDRVYQTSIPPPQDTTFHLAAIGPGAATLSPDGTRLVFSARDHDGAVRLYLRALDQPEAHVMSGTEGAQFPFWSPDSRWIAFFTQQDGTLKKVDASGGPPITICEAQNGKGGSWGANGTIVFAPNSGTALQKVSSAGGEAQDITEVDRNRHNSHRHPRFLPDGIHFLYLARGLNFTESAVMVGSLDGGANRELMRSGVQAEYAAGHIFFARNQTLMVQPFDADTLELAGEAKPVAEEALTIPAAAFGAYSVSPAGLLSYHAGAIEAEVAPMWHDRTGREIEQLGELAAYNTVALAPDDKSAAFTITPETSGAIDIWIYDLVRDLKTRFTFDEATDYLPIWAPDGQSIAFGSDRSGIQKIYRKGVGGVQEAEVMVEADSDLTPRGWSPDGHWLVYEKYDEETNSDIWAVPTEGDGEPRRLLAKRGVDVAGGISPDGRWLSYFSDESGRFEVYVTPFPDAGRRWQASTDSGLFPFWCDDGRQLVYQRIDGRLMSVEVELGDDTVRFGVTTELFDIAPPDALGPAFAPSNDGDRILVVPKGETSGPTLLNLIVGWPQILEEK